MKNLVGKRFGALIVLEYKGKEGKNHFWLCKCDCGNSVVRSSEYLIRKLTKTKSCGCQKGLMHKKHGKTNSRLYYIWRTMISRCENEKTNSYCRYGNRGIIVCKEWRYDFQNFYNWAIANGYDEQSQFGKCTIDRIDNNGNYCPENCRWVDMKTQNDNKRNNVIIEYNGEKGNLAFWAKKLNLPYEHIRRRYVDLNLPLEKVFYSGDIRGSNISKNSKYLLTYNGKTQTAHKWAIEFGVSNDIIYDRLKKGIGEEKIFEHLIKRRKQK